MSIMFDYAVKYNGRYYPPNTPIEEATHQKPSEAALSVQKPDPTSAAQSAEKAQQRKRTARQRVQKKEGD